MVTSLGSGGKSGIPRPIPKYPAPLPLYQPIQHIGRIGSFQNHPVVLKAEKDGIARPHHGNDFRAGLPPEEAHRMRIRGSKGGVYGGACSDSFFAEIGHSACAAT
jgi:hypothetical protein